MASPWLTGPVVVLALLDPAGIGAAAPSSLPFAGPSSLDALAGSLRGILVRSLPNPLYEASPSWGRTKRVPRGVKWKGKGLHVHPEVMYGDKNDGTWRKVRVAAVNVSDTLVFDLRDLRHAGAGQNAVHRLSLL